VSGRLSKLVTIAPSPNQRAEQMRFSSKRLDEVIKQHFDIPATAQVTRAALLPDLNVIEYVFVFDGRQVSKRIAIDEVRQLHQDVFSKPTRTAD
jgi:hypothetical protein